MTFRQLVLLSGYLAAIGVLSVSAQGANITLNTGDTIGNSSFNSAGNWSNAAAPSAGNNYFTGDFILRTPQDGNSYTFAGDSLTVNNTNGYPNGLLFKGLGTTGVITVNNLILNGGFISHAQGTPELFQLDGNITVASASTIYAKQGHINVLADIGGSANLTIPATDDNGNAAQRIVTLQGASTLSGNIDVLGKLTLGDTGSLFFDINAPGVNNAVTGTGVGVFNGAFNFDLTGASSTPGSSWTIVSTATRTFGATFNIPGFTASGSLWTNGTYLFNPATGILSVSAPPILWNVDGSGNWNIAANWVGNAVPGANADVQFDNILTAANAPATINLNVNASVNSITFNNTNQYILSGANTLTLTGLSQISAPSGTHEVAAVVAGTTGLTKTGGGDIILSANNTYTGTTNIQQGGLRIRNTGAVDGAVNVSAGATLFFEGDELGGGYNGTFTPDISGAGQVATSTNMTTETVTFSSAKSYTGQTTINNGTLQITGAGTLGTSDGTAATRTLVDGNESMGKLALSGGVTVANEVLVLEARELAAIDSIHLTSSGANTWSGNIKGEAGGTQYNIESTSGTLTLGGIISAPDTAVRNFVFSGAGNINVTGRIVDLASNADGAIVGTPVNALNNVNLIKRGTGRMTIGTATTNADDYWRGTSTVEAGTLEILSDGANNGELRSSTIAVAAGATLDIDHFGNYSIQSAQDLSGGGDIHAQTVSIFGDSLVIPGDNGVGTLTFHGTGGAGNANVYLGSDFFDAPGARGGLAFDLASATTVGGGVNDLIAGVNNLTLDVTQYDDVFTPLNTDAPIELLITLTENQLAGGGAGSYRLINYTGTLTNVANTAVSFAPQLQGVGQTRQTLAVSTTTPGQVNLVVAGAAATQTWTGATSNVWNINSATNWSGTGSVYFDLDNVVFNDSAGANDTVDIPGNVVPGSVTFNSATSNTYTITGAGGIVGNADVNLTGNVTAVIATAGNNDLGDIGVAGGATLQHGNGTSTGFTDVGGIVSGAGAVRVTSGSLQLAGNNTYTGVTTVNGGTLLVDNANALGNASGNTVINGGTVRSNGDTFAVNEPITFNGGAFAVGGGGPAALTIGGPLTVAAGGGTIQVDGNTGADGLTVTSNVAGTSGGAFNANIDGGSTGTFTGSVTNNGPLNKGGGGTLALTGTASITSPTINVNGGNLDVTGLASTFTVGAGQTLNANATVTGAVIGASGSTISGTGTYSNNVTAQTGSTVRVGGTGLPVFSSQFVIDDFESYAVGDVVNVATPPWTSHAAALTSDIEDAGSGNQVLSYGTGGLGGVSRAMPTSAVITGGETATVFFRLNPRTDDPDHSFGLADTVNSGGTDFGNFEVQIAALQGTTPGSGAFNLVARNAGTLTTVATDLPIDTWYNVWMVVDRTTNTFDVYMNTGSGAATPANLVADNFGFRNGPSPGPLNVLLGLSNTAPIDNGVRYDDVYYLNGEALNNPLAGLLPGNFFESQSMTVQGDLLMNAGATLALDIFSPTILDTLTVTGELGAAGTLAVSLNAGAPAPQLGNTFNILDFGSASGSFSSLVLPSLGSGLAWDTSALLTTGVLSVVTGGTPGDFDGDGDVDGRDFLVWQRGGSPTPLSAGDLANWKANYGAGPLVATSTSVPEPATWIGLLSAALAGLSLRRRISGGPACLHREAMAAISRG